MDEATISAYMTAAGENLVSGRIDHDTYRAIMRDVDPKQYERVLETMHRAG